MVRQRVIETGVLLALAVLAIGDGLVVSGQKSATQVSGATVGGYEMLLGALLAVFGVAYALRYRREKGLDWKSEPNTGRVFLAFGILMVYALAMPYLGYMLSTALVLVALLRFFSPYRLGPVIVASCLVAVGTAWLWAELVIALPTGFIPWP